MPPRPPGTPDVDLTFDGANGTINGAVFMTGLYQLVPDQFFSFLEVRDNGTEQGYNTDGALQQDQRDVHNSTHSILLAEVPIVIGDGSQGTQEGVAYREFRLNLGEAGNAKQYLSLDGLQIWQEESGSLINFTPGSGFAGAHTNYLAYNLDAGEDRWIGLKEGANGNGANQTEFTILIPDSFFINDPAHRYITLYSEFGMQAGWEADSSSEQWGLSHANGGAVSAMTVHKTATVPGGTANAVGEVISYAITVANVGNTNLTGLTVTDPSVTNLAAVLSAGFNVGDTNHDNNLSTGETWQYTASYTVTQSDVDSSGGGDGFITNEVTADTTQTAPVTATASVLVENGSSVDLEKTANVGSVDSAGDVITYTITVTNDGNTTLTSSVVEDSQVNIVTPVYNFDAPVLGPAFLAPVLDGDYNVGDTNENGFEDLGETFVFKNAGDEDGDGFEDPGETFLFTNVGDTNQNGAQDPGEVFEYYNAGDTNQNGVFDDGETFQFNVSHAATYVSGDADNDGAIDVGETWTYTVSYAVTQDDIDNGGVVDPALTHDNTATVSTAQGAEDNDSVSVSVVQDPRVTLTKGAVVADGIADEVGDVINYTINIANAGNMTLTDIDVTDPSVDGLAYVSGDADNDDKLDLTETWVYSASHTVTQDDIDNGGVVNPALTYDNTATVTTAQSEQNPDGDPDATASDSASVAIVQDPRVTLTKSAVVADGTADEVGDVINYTINIANAGNMTLTGINVTDPSVTGLAYVSGDDGDGKLELTETWVYTASHTVTQDDIDNGGVVNPALTYNNTASVTTAQGTALPSPDPDANDSDSESVPIVQDPRISLTKSGVVADGVADEVGDVINYTINVANAGNMTLTGINVTDPSVTGLALVSGDDGDGKLELGETWVYNASHTITQDDIDNGGVVDPGLTYDNTASVTTDQGTALPSPDPDANDSDLESVPIVQSPSIAVDKIATVPGDTADTAGEVIDYAISVTNNGNMTLTGVSVADPSVLDLLRIADALGGNNDNILNVGETWQYTASHTVTQAEIDLGGTIDNTASVTTTQGLLDPDANGSDSTSVTIVQPPLPPLTLDLSLSQFAGEPPPDVGDLIQFHFTFANNTGGTITSIQVTHTLPNMLVFQTANPGSLANEFSWNTTYEYPLDAGDLGAGEVTDEVTITALDQFNQPLSITEEWTVFL